MEKHDTLNEAERGSTPGLQNASNIIAITEQPPITTDEKHLDIQATAPSDPFLVTFSHPFEDEASNPLYWPHARKWAVTAVLSATGFNRIMISTIMAPALGAIARDLHMSNIEAVMSMSIYLLASAFGPLFIGPLSEVYGRSVVLHTTNVWFLVFNIVCGFAQTKRVLLAARFLGGFGASAIYALSGGVLGDVWAPEQRGKGLRLYSLIPLLGAGVGPILGGFIAEYTSWRWVFWSTSALQGVLVFLCFMLFRETHAPTILRSKAARIRRNMGNDAYYTAIEKFEAGRSVAWVLARSVSRPVRLLLFHPIIQVQACIAGFEYGMLYFVLSTFSSLWTEHYHETTTISGLHYLALCFGEIAGAQIGGPMMDSIYRKLKARANGEAIPEFRLPQMMPAWIIGQLGLIMYGWAAQTRIDWIVVDIGGFIWSAGMQVAGQALTAYTIDSYKEHVSSASAASQFLRSLAAFGFPLFAPKVYAGLGWGWGNTTIALISLVLGVPTPFLLMKYGPRLRNRAQSSY